MAKRYLAMMLLLFVIMLVLSVIIVFGIRATGKSILDLTVSQGALLCLLCSLLPIFACNGFATILTFAKGLTTKKPVLFVLLVLPITILSIPVGAITLLPTMIRTIKISLDK